MKKFSHWFLLRSKNFRHFFHLRQFSKNFPRIQAHEYMLRTAESFGKFNLASSLEENYDSIKYM